MDADSGITAKWKPYPEYKDSDLEWLGDVPKHWEVKRLKFIAIEPLKYGANESAELNDQELPRYIRITDIKNDGTLIENTFRSLPEENAKPYLLKQGDLLFARSGATVGKSFMYQATWGRACYAGYLIRLRINQSVAIPEFVSYFANSLNYWVWLSSIFIQATIQNVSAERYSNLFLAIPRLDEQHSIAAFLDRETAKIDALIAKKKQLIKLLQEKRAALISHAVTKGLDPSVPMKDSGVEWLGEIPAHWDSIRLKYICSLIKDGTHQPPSRTLTGVPLLSVRNIVNGKFINLPDDSLISEQDFQQLKKYFSVEQNDVLLAIVGATLGKVAIVEKMCCVD